MKRFRVVSKEGVLHVVDHKGTVHSCYPDYNQAYDQAQLLNENRIMRRLLSKKILKQIAKEAKP